MDWEPNERDAWVEDAQRWINKINGVLQSKIDLDENGEVTGVHVVAGMEREPRHIVRDVESLLKARLDLEVYYKKIGVVQVLDNGALTTDALASEPADEPAIAARNDVRNDIRNDIRNDARGTSDAAPATGRAAPPPSVETIEMDGEKSAPEDEAPRTFEREARPAVLLTEEVPPRLQCNGVGTMASNESVRAEVILQSGELEARGACEGPNAHASDLSLVARATLQAVGELLEEPVLLHLNEVRQETAGGRQLILAAIDLVEGRRTETLFGTCACEHNRQQAVVYAVLDALNRRLSLYAWKMAPRRTLEATG